MQVPRRALYVLPWLAASALSAAGCAPWPASPSPGVFATDPVAFSRPAPSEAQAVAQAPSQQQTRPAASQYARVQRAAVASSAGDAAPQHDSRLLASARPAGFDSIRSDQVPPRSAERAAVPLGATVANLSKGRTYSGQPNYGSSNYGSSNYGQPIVRAQNGTFGGSGGYAPGGSPYPTTNQPLFTPNYPSTGVGPVWAGNPEGVTGIIGPPEVRLPPPIDLDAVVHETQTGRMIFGVGVNSEAGLIGSLVIDEQNFDWRRVPLSWSDIFSGNAFRGGGQRFRLEAMPGTVVQRYMVSFTEPYLNDTPISFSTSAFFFNRRYLDWDEDRLGGNVTLGYQLPDDWSVTAGIRYEQIELTNTRVFPVVPEVAAASGTNDKFSGRVALSHDSRDSAFLPSQGHLFEIGFEQAWGSFVYPRSTIDASQYFTLHERLDGSGRHILGLSARFGVTGDDTPVYDNFYAGGISTLRGFTFRGASPRSGGVIVGGEFQLLGTVEYSAPLTADDMLRAATFVDWGTVERDVTLDKDTFRVAPGFGLRVSHRAFGPAPISIDFTFPVMKADTDDERVFSFFIGLAK